MEDLKDARVWPKSAVEFCYSMVKLMLATDGIHRNHMQHSLPMRWLTATLFVCCCATAENFQVGCIQNILRSPQSHAYRNKADFSIGFDVDRKPRAGHFFGLFRNGWSEVGPVDTIPQLSATAKGYAELMTRFLSSDKCNLPAWNKDAKPEQKVRSV